MSEGRIGGQKPARIAVRVYPTRLRRGNRMRGLFWASEPRRKCARRHHPRKPIVYSRPRLSLSHDGPFPVPEHLCGAAGELFRARGADAGRRSAADQAEPGAGRPSRPRSGLAATARRAPKSWPASASPRGRADRDGLCRPPVRPFRAAARRRPRHPARRGRRHGRRAPRHPAQGRRPDAVLAPRRRPRRARAGAARIHRQRGDGGAGHPDHALARRGDDRRAR